MDYDHWIKKVEKITGLAGHGSRKKIADLMGLTSETIKNSEKSGTASPKMVKSLLALIEDSKEDVYPKLHGDLGRWNCSKINDGVYVTHVIVGLAFTACFYLEDDVEKVKVAVYDDIEKTQLISLVDEARALYAAMD